MFLLHNGEDMLVSVLQDEFKCTLSTPGGK